MVGLGLARSLARRLAAPFAILSSSLHFSACEITPASCARRPHAIALANSTAVAAAADDDDAADSSPSFRCGTSFAFSKRLSIYLSVHSLFSSIYSPLHFLLLLLLLPRETRGLRSSSLDFVDRSDLYRHLSPSLFPLLNNAHRRCLDGSCSPAATDVWLPRTHLQWLPPAALFCSSCSASFHFACLLHQFDISRVIFYLYIFMLRRDSSDTLVLCRT